MQRVSRVVRAAAWLGILGIGLTTGPGGGADPAAVQALEQRIASIETRLTDTQDVMIALSEKLDRIDDSGRGKGGAT